MKFPTEQALLATLLIVVLLSMSTCNMPQQKCNIIHEAAPHLQKCEVW